MIPLPSLLSAIHTESNLFERFFSFHFIKTGILIDLVWQLFYYYGVIVARKEEIEKQGRITSFTYMLNNKKSLIGKTLAKIKPQNREFSFMAGQFVYTIVTMAPSAIWLYDSKFLSVLWLHVFFA